MLVRDRELSSNHEKKCVRGDVNNMLIWLENCHGCPVSSSEESGKRKKAAFKRQNINSLRYVGRMTLPPCVEIEKQKCLQQCSRFYKEECNYLHYRRRTRRWISRVTG